MKEIVRITMNSVKKKILKKDKRIGFELFGFDFMIDENGGLFLIEGRCLPPRIE